MSTNTGTGYRPLFDPDVEAAGQPFEPDRAYRLGDRSTAASLPYVYDTQITLAVNEACTNAIEHAYSPGPAEFEVEASADDGHLTIFVRDAGRWRAPRGRHRGRGLAIIDAVMEEVEINSGAAGSEIVMRRPI